MTTPFLKAEDLNLPDADIIYYPKFCDTESADTYFKDFLHNMKWKQHYIKIFGKKLAQPRLTALYAQNSNPYIYSGLTLKPEFFPPSLLELQQKLQLLTGKTFSHCLANLYRNGNDSMGLHADDEKELGVNPVIASLSLGATRRFRLKHKYDKTEKYSLDLRHESLLLMQGTTQHFWQHELPKSKKIMEPRINLTFRNILP